MSLTGMEIFNLYLNVFPMDNAFTGVEEKGTKV
jgi:hypothetical protein